VQVVVVVEPEADCYKQRFLCKLGKMEGLVIQVLHWTSTLVEPETKVGVQVAQLATKSPQFWHVFRLGL
jgi:hypothetical protein